MVVHAIYTYFFFLIHAFFSSAGNKKVVVITIFLSKLDHRPLFNNIYCDTILVFGLLSQDISAPRTEGLSVYEWSVPQKTKQGG